MRTKINNKKILYDSGRIYLDDKAMNYESLKCMVHNYLHHIELLKKIKGIELNQFKLNTGIKFFLFGIPCTVSKIFELYNEIAEIENQTVYSKLWYNPAEAVKFCPS